MNGIVLFYILQRLSEVYISRCNENWLKKNYNAIELSPKEGKLMIVLHSLWFLCLLLELNVKKIYLSGPVAIPIVLLLGLCLALRYHTIEILKKFWTIKVMKMENQVFIKKGIYRFIRHPNYLVVVLEFIFLPLLLGAYNTMIIFSLLNGWFLYKRIQVERSLFMSKNIFELVLAFLIFLGGVGLDQSWAFEQKFNKETYREAKDSMQFIRFESESTKLGLITTKFDGYAKSFTLQFDDISGKELKNVVLLIDVKKMDTDLNARNDKMIHEILDAEKYPQIKVEVASIVPLEKGEYDKEVIFYIKEIKFKKNVRISLEKVENPSTKIQEIVVTGSTQIGLKEASIPDPSILVAKVRDHFDLSFKFIIAK